MGSAHVTSGEIVTNQSLSNDRLVVKGTSCTDVSISVQNFHLILQMSSSQDGRRVTEVAVPFKSFPNPDVVGLVQYQGFGPSYKGSKRDVGSLRKSKNTNLVLEEVRNEV